MKTVGIIAEYNPFHRGHAYQIEQVRRQTGADYIVVVMSGNFVQRGTPAWTDKILRTKMALAGGAELVLELPACYATASAEDFAFGAVSLLHQLGFVDTLCFGSECGRLEPLRTIASFLAAPDREFEQRLRRHLKNGMSYPAARNTVLAQKFPALLRKYPTLLSEPNNILGIEYLKALLRLNSPLTPVTIARTDGGYHTARTQDGYLSASGIRTQLEKACLPPHTETALPTDEAKTRRLAEAFSALGDCIPSYVQDCLINNPQRFPLTMDDFSTMLYYRLRTVSDEEILSILDMTPELFHRMQQLLPQYTVLSDFITAVKTKQYTHTRISRSLLHLLLAVKTHYTDSPALYGRLLGFREDASCLLRHKGEIPVITKPADAERILASFYPKNKACLASLHWQTDQLADDIYRQAVYQKYNFLLPDTYHTPMVII